MELVVTRDSVAAGDDGDAPHERRLSIAPGAGVAEVVAPLRHCYLAPVSGGRATWVARAGGPDGRIVAVVAQQWDVPRYVVAADEPFGADRLHFGYLTQRDPDTVLAECRRGEEPRRRD